MEQDQCKGNIWIGQSAYMKMLIHKFGMSDCKPVKTPASPDIKLTSCVDKNDVRLSLYGHTQTIYHYVIGHVIFVRCHVILTFCPRVILVRAVTKSVDPNTINIFSALM